MISELKSSLRKEMLIKRAQFSINKKIVYDNWVVDQLINRVVLLKPKVVHVYLPMGKEIDIFPLIQYFLDNKITVVSPKTLPNRKLENRILRDLSDLEKGVFGTSHPKNPHIYKGQIDFIIIPGLAFDNNNYRLGYGGGYYDNFLKNFPNAHKVGIFYPFQKVEVVPREEHDVKLDEVICKV